MRYVILVIAVMLLVAFVANQTRPKEDRNLGDALVITWIFFVLLGMLGIFIKLTIKYW